MTVREIARSNALEALDQMGQYSTPQEAIDSYHDNAVDTAGVEASGPFIDAVEEWASRHGLVRDTDGSWVHA